MSTYIRRLRHWKQRFDENAEFRWRRPVTMSGKKFKAGDPVDKSLFPERHLRVKLRRFWEAGAIELAGFDAPDAKTGERAPASSQPTVERRGSWFVVDDGEVHKFRGRAEFDAFMKEHGYAQA